MEQILAGSTALITGGTAGIGKAVSRKFLEHGARVVILGSSLEKGEKAIQELCQVFDPQSVEFMQADVSDFSAVRNVVLQILEKYGAVDILVNNAGITRDQLMLRMKEEDWDRVMSVNVKSCFNLCQALLRSMIKARKGKIINMGSIIGIIGNEGQVNYAASKAAIIGFTRALAREIAPRNICVNCIAPGFIETDMTNALSDSQKEQVLKATPIGRIGTPEDVANSALFLASSLSDFITGQVINVDGGMVMGG